MTGTQLIEWEITRRLTGRGRAGSDQPATGQWAERLIAVLAVTAGLLLVGSLSEELLWAAVGVGTLVSLR